MDITNQTEQIDDELKILKNEIKQVLHNVQENVFSAQDPFGELPSVGTKREFASLAESQERNANSDYVISSDGGTELPGQDFSTSFEGDSPVSGLAQQGGDFVQASPAELSEFLASAGGTDLGAVGSITPAPSAEPGPGSLSNLNMDFASSRVPGDLTGASPFEAVAQTNEMNTGMSAAEGEAKAMTEANFPSNTDFEESSNQAAGVAVDTVQQGNTPLEPQMAITSEELKMDPQASIDALLAQQAARLLEEAPFELASELPMRDASVKFDFEVSGTGSEAETPGNGHSGNEYLHAGQVPPLPTVEPPSPNARPGAFEGGNVRPEKRPQQDVFSKAALTYALSPSHNNGQGNQGDQRSGDPTMDLITVAGLAQWAHGVLQRYGKEYLSAILEISQLTGRITKETQEIIMAITPLLESAATEKGISAKQIVSMLAQLDAFLGTVSASDSRLLPFLLQDEMEVFPLIRP